MTQKKFHRIALLDLKINNNTSSKSEDTSNNSTADDSKNLENMTKGLMSIKTVLFNLYISNSEITSWNSVSSKKSNFWSKKK
jgi:hypothetical protein